MEWTKTPVAAKYGSYLGVQRDGYREYLGVAYAKPPVGALRFAPPQEPDAFNKVVKADHFSNRCMQGGNDPFYGKEF